MLVYDLPEHEGDLMHYELRDEVAEKVKKRSSMIIVRPDAMTGRPMGYYASHFKSAHKAENFSAFA